MTLKVKIECIHLFLGLLDTGEKVTVEYVNEGEEKMYYAVEIPESLRALHFIDSAEELLEEVPEAFAPHFHS